MMPPPARQPDEESSANGWDLLDDYQVGKDVTAAEAEKTRRIARVASQDALQATRPEQVPTTRTVARTAFWRADGSADQDAEIMARILAGRREREEAATVAIARSRDRGEAERRERIRLRQQQEIADHLALESARRQPSQDETPLQRALREAADMFLALGICPDHLEWLPDVQRFCSWGGRIYEHAQVFAMRDARGAQLYEFGPSPHGPSTAAYSPRERRWRLHQAVAPAEQLAPVERLLPVPRRHADGSLRWSAKRPGTVLMDEGELTLYVVRNQVYTASHLIAAHHLHSGTSPLDRLLERAAELRARTDEIAGGTARAVDAGAASLGEKMAGAVGTATDALTAAISSTTRFFRRR